MPSPKELARAAAYADTGGLSDFGDRHVSRSRIEVTNAGDGLSAAMAVAPEELAHGEEVTIVIRGVVSKVAFRPSDEKDPDGPLARIHTIKAGTATLLDEVNTQKVGKALDAQEERIRRAVEAAAGVDPLPGFDGDTDIDPDDFDDDEPEAL